MNLIRWLKDVVKGLGSTTPVVQSEVVCEPHFKMVHFFSSTCSTHRLTSMVLGESTLMVSVTEVGGVAPIWVTYERLAMEACLQQLQDHGYFVRNFLYFLIK